MADEVKIETTENEAPQKTRRSFVKTAAQVAVTAPAVAVLLSGTAKAQEVRRPYTAAGDDAVTVDDGNGVNTIGFDSTPGDDFTGTTVP